MRPNRRAQCLGRLHRRRCHRCCAWGCRAGAQCAAAAVPCRNRQGAAARRVPGSPELNPGFHACWTHLWPRNSVPADRPRERSRRADHQPGAAYGLSSSEQPSTQRMSCTSPALESRRGRQRAPLHATPSATSGCVVDRGRRHLRADPAARPLDTPATQDPPLRGH
ncbi:MAG: hypothetical protein J3K34DRAFT_418139 [Monoraphidium minutum]|nr:MAG: hypothetical protein J3K34DRAFT_418139 [Monoraphidium minutum]